MVYIAFMMRIQHSQIDSAPEVFGEMAQIDWSEKNIPFNDKVSASLFVVLLHPFMLLEHTCREASTSIYVFFGLQ